MSIPTGFGSFTVLFWNDFIEFSDKIGGDIK